MPLTNTLQLQVGNYNIDLGNLDDLGFKIDYVLEEPENFTSKQGADAQSISVPATANNDKAFNTFWNAAVEDSAPAALSFRELMPCVVNINGTVPVLAGYAVITDATGTDKPEEYTLSLFGANGLWVVDLANVTLWDCVNPNSHIFDVTTVEGSWTGFGTTPDHDFVYAPVRYRQPFDGTTLGYGGDDCVNIYHLRPAISLLRLIERALNSIGFKGNWQVAPSDLTLFFNTDYFKNIVLPWTWGDFYDLNSQNIQGICFKASGYITTELPPINGFASAWSNAIVPFWSGANSPNPGDTGSAKGSGYWQKNVHAGYTASAYVPSVNPIADLTNGINATGGEYVFSGNGSTPGGNDWFRMNVSAPPAGFDNFLLYSFDESTGTMQYNFSPPPSLAGTLVNISATFVLSLYMTISYTGTGQGLAALECTHIPTIGSPVVTCQSIMPSGGAVVGTTVYPAGQDERYPLTPTNFSFTVPNLNPGDILKLRIRLIADTSGASGTNFTFFICTGGFLNNNPSVLHVPTYSYNPVTESFQFFTPNAIWSPVYSSLAMTGFLIQLGNNVNLQDYDAFRNYQILDMLGGVIDMFDLEVQTDNINKVITMEPMFGSTLPTSENIGGYFSTTRILDYSNKQDNSRGRGTRVSLYSSANRQLDLTFKLDGNDGCQNIWAQRYKGIYLNNRTYTGGVTSNNINIDNGIIAGIPGAARYMLPNRFAKGNQQLSNRFFSALMHVKFPQWIDINGTPSPAPQLPCIFSDGSNSDTAYKDVFTPKLAWYAGQTRSIAITGGWRWIGDPANPNPLPLTANPLPFMFSVNYGLGGDTDPVLSYCDESLLTLALASVQGAGLLSQFYRSRFAIMRNGQLLTKYLRLNLSDICNWTHRECVIIDGALYAIIKIDGFDPITDNSAAVTMWKFANVEQIDIDNSFPSSTSISAVNNPIVSLGTDDLRYAKLLLYPTDVPQIG